MLSQGKYVVEILKRFRMMDCKSMTMLMTMNLKLFGDTTYETVDATLYMQMIGSLMYLMNTRLDICFAVNTLRQYMVELKHVHLIAAKHVMRYLKGTLEYGIKYDVDCEFRMQDTLMQIGLVVSQIEKVHQNVVSVWDQV